MKRTLYTVCVLWDDADNESDAWAETFADAESAGAYARDEKNDAIRNLFGRLEEGDDYMMEEHESPSRIEIMDHFSSRYCCITRTEQEIEV